MGLGTTLLVTTVVVTLGFALSGLSVSQLNRTKLAENRQRADHLADSAAALALERLVNDATFASGTLTARGEGDPAEAVGLLTFDAATARREGLPVSCNNLENLRSTTDAEGHLVPAASARLIAQGRCGGVKRCVEVIVHAPPFPYAAASAGRINVSGRVFFGGVASAAEAPLVSTAAEPLPADIGAASIKLDGEVTVTGDARSEAEVEVADPSRVHILGRKHERSEPLKLPDVPLTHYDPAAGTRPYVALTSLGRNPSVAGLTRYRGNLTVDGDLNLDTGLLFVDGDLHVTGGIKGKGGVVATGELKVDRACALDARNRLALLAGKDVELGATPGTPSYVQGNVYTHGNFRAAQVNLVGSVIARGANQLAVIDGGVVRAPEYDVITVGGQGNEEAGTLRVVARPNGFDTGRFTFTIRAVDATHLRFQRADGTANFVVDVRDRDSAWLQGAPRQQIHTGLGITHLTEYEVPATGARFTTEGNFEALVAFYDSQFQTPEASQDPVITFDPSQFLRPEDRVHVALWRTIP